MEIEQTKVCSKCGKSKSLKLFYKDKRGKFGVYAKCKICHEGVVSVWREANKEKMTEHYRTHRQNNQKQLMEYYRVYRQNNRAKIREANRAYWKNKAKDPIAKLNHGIRRSIWAALKGKKAGRHWEDLVGYTLEQLKKHLEKQFAEGMAWLNYGEWHVDHKIPIAVFNFTKPEHRDFKRCWALSNLQPLWALDNISKGAKIDKHFQPSLAI